MKNAGIRRQSACRFAMLLLAALAAPQAGAAPIPVANPGFEDDANGDRLPDAWKANGKVSTTAGDGRSADAAHSGLYALLLNGNGKKKELTQTISASGSAGEVHYFSAWVRGDNLPSNDTGQLTATFYHKKGKTTKVTHTLPAGSYDWLELKKSVSVPKAYSKVTLALTLKKSAGSAAFDDVSLAPEAAPPPPAAGPGPTIAGCPQFPADASWNTPVTGLPVHPKSADWVAFIGTSQDLHPDFGSGTWNGGPIGIPYNVVTSQQVAPAVIDDIWYPDETDPGPYNVPANPQIEGGPNSSGDRHILIVDTATCRLQEIYHAVPDTSGAWDIGSGAVWDLGSNQLRTDGWTSADAAGLPILPLLVRYDEAASGEIRHALRFTANGTTGSHLWPARHHAQTSSNPDAPPMGARFRLRAGYAIPPGTPAEVAAIVNAMKTYGLVLADNGSDWFISGVPDERWDNDALHAAFDAILGSDFEAVDVSCLRIGPDSAQSRPAPCP